MFIPVHMCLFIYVHIHECMSVGMNTIQINIKTRMCMEQIFSAHISEKWFLSHIVRSFIYVYVWLWVWFFIEMHVRICAIEWGASHGRKQFILILLNYIESQKKDNTFSCPSGSECKNSISVTSVL